MIWGKNLGSQQSEDRSPK